MKKQVFYELNALHYSDRTNTGTGDFAGLATKVDYFEFLGVNSVIFQNVLAINEVDKIQNYTSITKPLGNINEFKRVISLLKGKGIDTIIELGIGTIKENHKWFKYAVNQTQEEYRSIVNFRSSDLDVDDKTQTLKYSPKNKSYYLINEDTKEVPLNWLSDQVIESFVKIVKFWNQVGVDGFTFKGFEYLADETKQESMNEDTLKQLRKFYRAIKEVSDDIVVIGRSSEIDLKESLDLTTEETKVFDYFISDQFYKLGSSLKYGMDEIGKFKPRDLGKMIKEYAGHPSQVIAFGNPATGRVNSRWGDSSQYQYQSAKSIALALFATPSSALIYYGDELGIFNIGLTHLDDFQDETLEARKRKFENLGLRNKAFMAAQVMQNPINSRSLMPWNDEKNGGFSYEDRTITPVNADYKDINVAAQYGDVSSPLMFYKKMISIFSKNMTKDEQSDQLHSFEVHVSLKGVIKYSFRFGRHIYIVFVNISPKIRKIKPPKTGKVSSQTYFHKAYKVLPTTLSAFESIIIAQSTKEDETKTIEINIAKEVNVYRNILISEMDKKHDEIIQALTDELTIAQDEAEAKRREYEKSKLERKKAEEQEEKVVNEKISKTEAEEIIKTAKERSGNQEELEELEKTRPVDIMKIDNESEKLLKEIAAESEKIKKIKEQAKIEMMEKMRAAEDAIFAELGVKGSSLREDEIALTTVLEDDDEIDFN